MTCKVSQPSHWRICLSLVTAGLSYLHQRGFLHTVGAGVVRGGVGHAVDLGQDRGLDGLEVGAALRGRVARGQTGVVIRPGVGGHAVGPAAQPGGLGGRGTTGGVLRDEMKT